MCYIYIYTEKSVYIHVYYIHIDIYYKRWVFHQSLVYKPASSMHSSFKWGIQDHQLAQKLP